MNPLQLTVSSPEWSVIVFANATEESSMPLAKVLIVDDDEMVRSTLSALMQERGFATTVAENVPDALKCIVAEPYDVLLSDLHMPSPGDGLTVVSAMKHANPKAVTLLLTSFPEMELAARTILAQADEILIKPIDVARLIDVIKCRLADEPRSVPSPQSIATILERNAKDTIADWYDRIELEDAIMSVPMSFDLRCEHLPMFFRDLVARLKMAKSLKMHQMPSHDAERHGIKRRGQGYTPQMIVEESRMLQISIFHTLQDHLDSIDFRFVLLSVMTIADEVDSQLSQAMAGYMTVSSGETLKV